LQHYNLALENGFDEFWVKYNRGSLLTQLGNLDAALVDIRHALDLRPNNTDVKTILKLIQSALNISSDRV
ncbi:MAG: tetratricopeptide repeat protein, partial [Thermoproteota archaeon]|nr:tetratricopeptide repeat protein [Thermoproteota archaeon]